MVEERWRLLERAKNERVEDRIKRRQYQFDKAIVLHGVETKLVAKNKNYITDFGCVLIIQRTCTCKKKRWIKDPSTGFIYTGNTERTEENAFQF